MTSKKIDLVYTRKAILCVGAGTFIGIVVYQIFLFFKIAIFGWNLGLIFAPLAAGYIETILANKIIGENIGAISAFILFLTTTIYSFILKNPTLGFNLITIGASIVILQAAFPTAVNYIILVVIGGFLSNFVKYFKKFAKQVKFRIENQDTIRWETKNEEIITKALPYFDETESNEKINSLDFYFLTSSDMKDRKHEIIKIYQSEVIIEKNSHIIKVEPERAEQEHLKNIKEGKDECLIKLAKNIKEHGGNGILDLHINYSLIGLGDNIQITATGMGIIIYT